MSLNINNWKSISKSFQICNNWFHKNSSTILFNRMMFWAYSRTKRRFFAFFIVYVRLTKIFIVLIVDFLYSIIKAIFHFIKSSSKISRRCSFDESRLICQIKTSFCKHRYKLLRISSTSWIAAKFLTRLMNVNTSRYMMSFALFFNAAILKIVLFCQRLKLRQS